MEQFLNSDFLIIIPALNGFGYVLKHGFPQLPNRLIPIILMIGGILFTCGLSGISIVNIIQGMLVSFSAMGIHSIGKDQVKSIKNKEKN